jgi:hypothetical protein
MGPPATSKNIAFGLLGAAAGGALGYFLFFWMARQGFYTLILPPALVGLGAGLCARRRSSLLAVICAVAGLALGIFTEWQLAPFIKDNSLGYFLTHIHNLRPVTLIMLAIGTFLSYRLGLGFDSDN